MAQSIQNLTKVAVTLRVAGGENFDLTQTPVPFDFIYGVGTEGLCLFESALSEKQEGEKVTLSVRSGEAGEIFGYLRTQIYHVLGIGKITEPLFLEVTIHKVGQADNREVVQAIAKAASQGGCGGSCGCGC